MVVAYRLMLYLFLLTISILEVKSTFLHACYQPKIEHALLTSPGSFGASYGYGYDTTYRAGSQLTIVCRHGYQLVSGSKYSSGFTTLCTRTGAWAPPARALSCVPKIKETTCEPPPVEGLLLRPSKSIYQVKETVRYTCDDGYTLVGKNTGICTHDGVFVEIPACHKDKITCVAPEGNGLIVKPSRTSYYVEDNVQYSCEDGYLLIGERTGSCSESGIFLNVPFCNKIKTCTAPQKEALRVLPFWSEYSIGDTVSYTCEEGYLLIGDVVGKCGRSGFFINVPFCNKLKTCDRPEVEHLDMSPDKPIYIVKDVVKYSCKDGYLLIGKSTSICTSSGVFEDVPICHKSKSVCGHPDVKHLNLSPDKPMYNTEEVVTYRCEEGYKLVGKTYGICTSSGFFVDIPVCHKLDVSCKYPGNPDNGRTKPSKPTYDVGEVIAFECDDGYVLGGIQWARCTKSGKFSEKLPTCEGIKTCPEPSSPENGFLITSYRSKQFYKPHEYVMFKCNVGYQLIGSIRSTCSKAGVFIPAPPTCKKERITTCQFPGNPTNGQTRPGKPIYDVGQSVIFLCRDGFERDGAEAATCLDTGSFSENVPTCKKSCNFPGLPNNGNTTPIRLTYEVDDVIIFSCTSGYEIEGAESATCQASGEFSKEVPECKKIVKCSKPQLPSDGSLMIASTFKELYEIGETIIFECKSGYILIGRSRSTCSEAGVFKPGTPACEVVPTCDEPDSLENGKLLSDKSPGSKYSEGEVVGFECNEGYVLEGAKRSICAKVGGRLEFQPSNRFCRERTCFPPRSPDNGRIINPKDEDSEYTLGVKVIFACNEKYTLVGERVSTCSQINGKLDYRPPPPTCERKTCSAPPESVSRTYVPTKSLLDVGDVVSFYCINGFLLFGEQNVTCVDQDQFSSEFPTCERVRCSRPERPEFGKIKPFRGNYGIGDTVTFSCREGYKISGSETATCTLVAGRRASFSPESPSCQRQTCRKPNIPLSGSLSPDRDSYYVGDRVAFLCDDGYKLKGVSSIVCEDQDVFSDEEPECEAITCERPGEPDNGYIRESNRLFRYEEEVTYACDAGYNLEGSETRTCQENGKFSSRMPRCAEIRCKIPLFLRNGEVSASGKSYITYRETVSYSCEIGYNLVGADTASCEEDGSLTEIIPTCEAIICDALPRSFVYSVSPLRTRYSVGDVITIECAEGYRSFGSSTSECLQTGEFSVTDPKCEAITCSFPGSILNGKVSPEKSQYRFGDRVLYFCSSGYNLVGQSSSTCGGVGVFEGSVPLCEPFTCPSLGILRFGTIQPVKENYKVGDTITFLCRSGYELEGSTSSRCLLGGSFSEQLPQCTKTKCSLQEVIEFGIIFPLKKEYSVNERVTFSCEYGYELKGESVSVCGTDGEFSDAVPRCIAIKCRNPGSPKYGSISPDRPTYGIGEDITFNCKEGYLLRGASVASCVDENVFSAAVPTCEEIGCSFPGNPDNGFTNPVQSTYPVGSRVDFECRSGYMLEGKDSTRCEKGGSFADSLPTCEEITCENPGVPRFGEIFPDRSSYTLGQTVSFSCSEGYKLEGEYSIDCEEDGKFSDSIPTCKEITCKFPGKPDNGNTTPRRSSYSVNDEVTFECEEGYELIGLESSRCTGSGRFTGFVPTCKLAVCNNPGSPKFGSVSPNRPKYAVGDIVSFSCDIGYLIDGITTTICQDNGKFSDGVPSCQEVTCSFPGNPMNGVTSPTRFSYDVGAVIKFECEEGFTISGTDSARCLESGAFSSALPSCNEITCGNPGSPSSGSIKPNSPTYNVDQRVTFECDDGYELEGTKSSVCETSGRFSDSVPTCERISCSFPGNPVDGFTSPTRSFYSIGEEITFECKEGFALTGAQSAKCQDDKTFSKNLPTCRRSTCNYPGRPSSGYTNPNLPIYNIGDEVSYSCRRGFRIVGTSVSTCGKDGQFDNAVPSCKRATCSFPGNPDDGDTIPTRETYTFRQRVTFSCREGYTIVGAISAFCQVSGKFSEELPSCQRVICRNPGSPRDGSIFPRRPTYSVEEDVEFRCDEGYKLSGSSISTCLENGEFSRPVPSCERISCDFPGNPVNGVTSPTQVSYAVGIPVTFTCIEGFELDGSSVSTCEESGKFSSGLPTCKSVTCSNFGLFVNGKVIPDLAQYPVRQKVIFSCDDGYELVGETSSVCEAEGSFSNGLPRCERKVCQNPGSPKYGSMSPDLPTYSIGQKIIFSCNTGYRIEGNFVITCDEDGSFLYRVPVCEPITCKFPGNPLGGSTSPNKFSYSYKEQVTYSCNPGYLLVGNSEATCGARGLFSENLPTCERNTCDNPGRPKYGKMSPDLSKYAVGQKIQFSCNDGYEIDGVSTLTCQQSGSFSPSAPTCKAIRCKYPGQPKNGATFPVSETYSFDELIRFRCDNGYTLHGFMSAKCERSGSFSASVPECKATTCKFPGSLTNGDTTPTKTSYDIGEDVTYSCRSGYMLMGAVTRTCELNGRFTGKMPSCERKTCKTVGKLRNGFVSPNLPEYTVNQVITFTCDTGYKLEGATSSTCMDDGKFLEAKPTCKIVPSCKNPGAPDFGTISSTRPIFNVKDSISYVCNFGYRLDGTPEAECLPSGLFSAPKPTCEQINCGFPGSPINGFTSPKKARYLLGDTVNFRCDSGYVRIGIASSKCTGSGDFVGKIPTCNRVVCNNPGAPEFGKMLPDEINYVAGQSVRFSCLSGYRMNGRDESECGKNGDFLSSFPTCERIVCANPGAPSFGSLEPDLSRYLAGTTVTFSCNAGFDLDGQTKSKCDNSGRFTNPPPLCRRKTCRHPKPLEYGFVSPVLPIYTVGQKVRYACLIGYELIGEDTDECGENGQFSGIVPTCELKVVACNYPGNPTNGATLPKKDSYSTGEQVTFQCDKGYVIFGAVMARCSTAGRFSEILPTCRSVTCNHPGTPIFGSISPDIPRYTVSQNVVFSCNDGYKIKGVETTMCDYNGQFEDPVPKCERTMCRNPGKPDFGTMTPDYVTYSIGQTITFSCSREYNLDGFETTKCNNDGSFTNPVPTCERRSTCRNPGLFDGGSIEPNYPIYSVGQEITFSCMSGYRLEGAKSAICEENGRFSDPRPVCRMETCKNPGRLSNGDMFPDLPTYSAGQSIKYFCNDGFIIQGSQTTTCEKGIFTNPVPVCERITCRFPGTPVNGKTVPRKPSYKLNERVEYECDKGYIMVGDDTSVCTRSGDFSESLPLCKQASCDPLKEPINGRITPLKSSYDLNDIINFECDEGYQIIGEPNSRCSPNGEFSSPAPMCRRVKSCGFLGNPINGKTLPRKATYLINESVRFECEDGYRIIGPNSAFCLESEEFSETLPTCEPSRCLNPGQAINGKTIPSKQFYDTDEVVEYRCDEGYQLIGEKTARCRNNGQFSAQPPSCTSVKCSYPGTPDGGSTVPRRATYNGGEIIEFSCKDECYELVGSKTAICMPNGLFSQEVPSCEPKMCLHFPTIPNFGTLEPLQKNYTCGQKIDYNCFAGYRRTGPTHTSCLPDGTFEKHLAECEVVKCKPPPTLRNGFTTTNFGGMVVFENVVTYRCRTGYRMVGVDSIKCGEDGSYIGAVPECKAILCQQPRSPSNGRVISSGRDWRVGEVMDFQCDEHYTIVGKSFAVCQGNGEWNNPPPTCAEPICHENCHFPRIRGRPCQCDEECQNRGDCCNDYKMKCTLGTCKNRCGAAMNNHNKCSCDDLCATRFGKNCCQDYKMYCSDPKEHSSNMKDGHS
ncbi:CUB and sushi domain-containing protein 1-like isoform X3 [Styela clava]